MMKFKYLFISRTLRGGGAERFISTFTNYLANCGYEVNLLLYEKTEQDYYSSDKVKKTILPDEPISLKGKLLRLVDVYKAISSINPDVIIPFVDTVVISAFMANCILNKKFVYTVRVSPWHQKEVGNRFSNLMRTIIADKADAIMLQTAEQGEFFPKSYRNREYVVPNPIPEKYREIEKTEYRDVFRRIVLTARLEKQKNIPLLISAFNEVIKGKNNEIELYIYGEGTEKENIQTQINSLKINNVCHLMGLSNDIETVLKNADMFIMTSDYEGMPNSLMEAMAIGVPCISSKCKTGPKDLIDEGNTGILFETGSKEELVNKMNWALEHTELMNRMGRCARKRINEMYTNSSSKKKFDQMIDAIM